MNCDICLDTWITENSVTINDTQYYVACCYCNNKFKYFKNDMGYQWLLINETCDTLPN